MNIPSPKEEGSAKWLSRLTRFATNKRTLTRAGVIASSFALRELLRWLLHMIRSWSVVGQVVTALAVTTPLVHRAILPLCLLVVWL